LNRIGGWLMEESMENVREEEEEGSEVMVMYTSGSLFSGGVAVPQKLMELMPLSEVKAKSKLWSVGCVKENGKRKEVLRSGQKREEKVKNSGHGILPIAEGVSSDQVSPASVKTLETWEELADAENDDMFVRMIEDLRKCHELDDWPLIIADVTRWRDRGSTLEEARQEIFEELLASGEEVEEICEGMFELGAFMHSTSERAYDDVGLLLQTFQKKAFAVVNYPESLFIKDTRMRTQTMEIWQEVNALKNGRIFRSEAPPSSLQTLRHLICDCSRPLGWKKAMLEEMNDLACREMIETLERKDLEERITSLKEIERDMHNLWEDAQLDSSLGTNFAFELEKLKGSIAKANTELAMLPSRHDNEDDEMSILDMVLAMTLQRSFLNCKSASELKEIHESITSKWREEFGRLPFLERKERTQPEPEDLLTRAGSLKPFLDLVPGLEDCSVFDFGGNVWTCLGRDGLRVKSVTIVNSTKPRMDEISELYERAFAFLGDDSTEALKQPLAWNLIGDQIFNIVGNAEGVDQMDQFLAQWNIEIVGNVKEFSSLIEQNDLIVTPNCRSYAEACSFVESAIKFDKWFAVSVDPICAKADGKGKKKWEEIRESFPMDAETALTHNIDLFL